MRTTILQTLYRMFPFHLQGDCRVSTVSDAIRISCIINFYGRLDLLQGVLCSLAEQQYPKERFEVLLVEDRAGTEAGRQMAADFSDRLQIRYLPLDKNFGQMGYSRNYGLARSQGELVLFLDDDTVLLQQDFLAQLDRLFEQYSAADALVPHGHAAWSCREDPYVYHDPYFMTSRCTAYRRQVLQELGGFMSAFVGQEDVEYVTRFTIAGKSSRNCPELQYYHPPLLVPNTRKPRAVGFSFYGLKGRYSWPVWLLLLANCARHAPLALLPGRRLKEQGRFGIGFLLGVLDGIRGNKGQVYG
jgi:glycosyltransferase involved in cell wall biosynthesis